jgi:hypothetical protein
MKEKKNIDICSMWNKKFNNLNVLILTCNMEGSFRRWRYNSKWDEIFHNEMKYLRMRWKSPEGDEIYKNEMKYIRMRWNIPEWDEILQN